MKAWIASLATPFLTAFAAASVSVAQPVLVSRPNILFIMVDEMRWDVMSCAQHPFVKTPNLDRLAREGTRFAATYTCSPVCGPSRYSFSTSRYIHVHRAILNEIPSKPGELLLPEILRHYGYETAMSGKLHFVPS